MIKKNVSSINTPQARFFDETKCAAGKHIKQNAPQIFRLNPDG